MIPIIQAHNLSRFYGIVLGLNNVTFSIRPGITGVVGPNGAGKTTLFRLLTGQIKASSGTLTVFGENPWSNASVQARLAYCPESENVPAGTRDETPTRVTSPALAIPLPAGSACWSVPGIGWPSTYNPRSVPHVGPGLQ